MLADAMRKMYIIQASTNINNWQHYISHHRSILSGNSISSISQIMSTLQVTPAGPISFISLTNWLILCYGGTVQLLRNPIFTGSYIHPVLIFCKMQDCLYFNYHDHENDFETSSLKVMLTFISKALFLFILVTCFPNVEEKLFLTSLLVSIKVSSRIW